MIERQQSEFLPWITLEFGSDTAGIVRLYRDGELVGTWSPCDGVREGTDRKLFLDRDLRSVLRRRLGREAACFWARCWSELQRGLAVSRDARTSHPRQISPSG